MADCCVGPTVGNLDNDPRGFVDIVDLTLMTDHLFITFPELICPATANLDGDPLGVVDIVDLTAFIAHLFITFEPLPSCP